MDLNTLLTTPNPERKSLLRDLQILGSLSEIITILDLILDVNSSILPGEKRFLINNILIPSGSYLLPPHYLSRILGLLGYPRKGSKGKLLLTVQAALLLWTVNILPLFGRDGISHLRRHLPILFNHLAYEYLRPMVGNLIFMAVSGDGLGQLPVKLWQLLMVVDVYNKFPHDETLAGLIGALGVLGVLAGGTFSVLRTSKDLGSEVRARGGLRPHRRLVLPHSLWDRVVVGAGNSLHREAAALRRAWTHAYRGLSTKRVKLPDVDVDMVSRPSVYDLGSVEDMAAAVGTVPFRNVASVVGAADGLKGQFLVVEAAAGGGAAVAKFDAVVASREVSEVSREVSREVSLLHDTTAQLLQNFPSLFHHLPSVADLMVRPVSVDIQLAILPFLPLQDVTPFLTTITTALDLIPAPRRPHLDLQLYRATAHLLHFWYLSQGEPALAYIDAALAAIMAYAHRQFHHYSILPQLSFLHILGFIGLIPDLNHDALSPAAVVVPPHVLYHMLLTANPLVVSEACGYVARVKSYRGGSHEPQAADAARARKLIHSYVVDAVDMVWRDRAFTRAGAARGLMLPPPLVHGLGTLGLFAYSALLQPLTVANLFHGPAWSYIVAHIVWAMEDERALVRHPGPVSEDLAAAQDDRWLGSYHEVKVEVLNRLEARGFGGVAELVFGTLRSLGGRRWSLL